MQNFILDGETIASLFLHCRAIATIVVPFCPSSYFWPIISRKNSRFVVDCKCFGAFFFLPSNIAPVHLEFFPDHLRVFVPRAKNDIYREGNYVYIKRLASQYCPVAPFGKVYFQFSCSFSSSKII